jgi:DNA-binding PadR family transcriptional regulator
MSIQLPVGLEVPLSPTSYLVLGLLEREGPSTPYELKRHVAATIGHIWSFPHALLYKEPARLAALGLLSEERELIGRRRRLFTITPAGQDALRIWLGRPAQHPTELRDLALLQLFFSDLESAAVTLALADEQLALHQRRLASYEADMIRESPNGSPTTERWRGVTVRMALLYECAAVEFWGQVAADARPADDAA